MPARPLAPPRRLLRLPLALLVAVGALAPAARALDPEVFPVRGPWDPAIPSPEAFLGHPLGTWHLPPERIESYLRAVADASPRVAVETIGLTHEGRPQILLTITSEERLARLEAAREEHLAGTPDGPAVIWLGCSIHGNEASGAHAAVELAWRLAASLDPATTALLAETVVLLDPMLNPDGLARFATWANMHRGARPVGDPWHREHREDWPNGRTNHYWFDLNRDWLPAVHPETRNRLAVYRRWFPHVLVDLHEMGGSPDFFFQPGVPTRQHPLTPQANFDLTSDLARFPAGAFDRAGVAYYTEETFDDFYYGKGSTYPDVQGSVGILFEQGSVRGHLRDTPAGPLDFATAIQRQLLAALALVDGARAHREDLIAYRRTFHEETRRDAAASPVRAWAVGDDGDPARLAAFVELLGRHRIEVRRPAGPVEIGARTFAADRAVLVPADQAQFRLVQSLFERRQEFEDSVFYDVSAWTLPLAWGLPDRALDRAGFEQVGVGPGLGVDDLRRPPVARCPELPDGTVAVAIPWNAQGAPAAARRLLEERLALRGATRSFVGDGDREFSPGTLTIALGAQRLSEEETRAAITTTCRESDIEIHALSTGLTPDGIDLGSPSLPFLELPRPTLVVGRGVDAYAAGSMWHRLDHDWGFPVRLLDRRDLDRAPLDETTHLILVDGRWKDLSDEETARIRRWTRDGGILVTLQQAAEWAESALFPEPATESKKAGAAEGEATGQEEDVPDRRDWSEKDRLEAEKQIGGAILSVDVDPTHPLGFGYPTRDRAVFRQGRVLLETPRDPFARVAVYSPLPLMAGFATEKNRERLAGTPAVLARRAGRGVVVQLADDPTFRGFWREGDRLLANVLFYAPVLAEDGPG